MKLTHFPKPFNYLTMMNHLSVLLYDINNKNNKEIEKSKLC